MGLLVSGGSMATMTALAVARHVKSGVDVRANGLRSAPRPFAFYMSSEAHGCARKAIELLGFGSATIRTIPISADYRMKVDALDAALAGRPRQQRPTDRGRSPPRARPTPARSTTSTAIAEVCRQHDVWMHVDAAYGGPAILTDEYAERLAALARADSIALDPHKWMFVPVEAGLVLVRDAEAMRSAFSLVPPYLRTDGSTTGVGGPPWFSEYGFQQTRGFRALKVWMTMQQFGLTGLKAAIEENLALAALSRRSRRAPRRTSA